MALEGTIKDFGLPDIFQLIGLQRKTGILTLRSDKESVTVVFENGMVVNADSSQRRLEDRLGGVLVKQGKISKERLEEVLSTQRATLQRLGHILTTGGYITGKDLKDALQVQVSQIVFKVFRWRDGEYHFAPTDTADWDRENFSPMSADFILMEGIRMVDEWPIIEKKIPSLDIVFRTVVDHTMIEVGSGDDDDKRGAASSKIRLSPEEDRIFRKVDGTRTVQGVIDASGLGEFEVCRNLFDFLNRNLIAPVGRAGAAKEAAAQREGGGGLSGSLGYGLLAGAAVLSLAGIALQLRTPFGVVGRPSLLSHEVLRQDTNRQRLERLDRAILAYHLAHGTPPGRLEDLVGDGLVDDRDLRDPWSRPYHYGLTEKGLLLNAVDAEGRTVPGTLIERTLPRLP